MRELLYRLLTAFSPRLGIGVVAAFAWLVATGYFLFLPRRLLVSFRLYRALFPGRGRWHALCCAWRQYHHFAGVFAERLRLQQDGALHHEAEGWEQLAAAASSGRGGILLMSHLGSWEVAARLLQRQGLRLLLYMGAKQREQIERLQKSDLRQEGVRVLAQEGGAGSPFAVVEGLAFLRDGGFVSLAGDRSYDPHGRTLTVRFLGQQARLPRAPWALALLSRAPVYCFFALRTGKGRYLFRALPPLTVQAVDRADREAAMQQAAQRYATSLEEVLRGYPEQWYTFAPFLEAGGEG